MKRNRHATAATLLAMVWACSGGFFLRFEAPGLIAWITLMFGSMFWVSLHSPGFKRARHAWRDATLNRSVGYSTDPKAQA